MAKVKIDIKFRCNKWQRAGLIAGAMGRAALGRDCEQGLRDELNKYIHISEPYIDG